MNDRFLITLVGCSRCASTSFYGQSGRTYTFRWSESHRAMVYEGRELSAAEFDAIAGDLFSASAEQNFSRPVPKRLPSTGAAETINVLTVPRFDTHSELLRLCGMLGKSEIECARLQKILESKGTNYDRSSPPPAARPAPAPEPAQDAPFVDFDPDADAPARASKPSPAPVKPTPQMIPTINPAPHLDGGDFDPDEIPAGYSPA